MQGVIERMNGPSEAKFGKKYGFLIDGKWHDYFTKYPLPEGVGAGAMIDFDSEVNGVYAPKIKRMKVVSAASGAGSMATAGVGEMHSERELSIMRQNAMTNANTFLCNNDNMGKGYDLSTLLETAEILTGFYSGKISYKDLQETPAETVVELAKKMVSSAED